MPCKKRLRPRPTPHRRAISSSPQTPQRLPRNEPPPANAAETPPLPKKRPANTAVQPPAAQEQPPVATQAPPAAKPPAPLAKGQAGPQEPTFDPSMLKRQHPKFGEAPPADAKVNLPKDEAAIPKGGAINAGAGRTIVKEADGQVTVRHDDASRFVRPGGKVNEQKGPNGTLTTTVDRPDGAQVVTIKDASGNILQRYRKNRDGSVEVLIGAVEPQRGARTPPPAPKPQGLSVTVDFGSRLPPLRLTIPRNDYIVESSRASRRQIEQTFAAPPVEQVERPYTLEEIRRSDRIRNKVRRVDFDTVTFEFGSAVLPDDQIPQTQKVGEAMRAVLDKDPNQVFLIEGYTDAVGSDLANLALSDRRAETVAEILTYYFANSARESHHPGLWRAVPEDSDFGSRTSEPARSIPQHHPPDARRLAIAGGPYCGERRARNGAPLVSRSVQFRTSCLPSMTSSCPRRAE